MKKFIILLALVAYAGNLWSWNDPWYAPRTNIYGDWIWKPDETYTYKGHFHRAEGESYKCLFDGDKTTKWCSVANGAATAIEETNVNRQSSNRKFIFDGQLYIIRDDKVYTITGQLCW